MKPQISPAKRRLLNIEDNLTKLSLTDNTSHVPECKCGLNIDHSLLNDDKILNTLLRQEESYVIRMNYLNKFQTKISETMRCILSQWMLELCEEQECTDDVYSLSMNLFDRLLCVLKVEKRHLQLLGCVCLFIASKLKQTNETYTNHKRLTADILIDYTDNSITLEELLDWELLVLHKLKWDVSSIVPNDFVDILIHKLNHINIIDSTTLIPKIRKHTLTLTALCSTDIKFSMYPASMIAGACLMASLDGLKLSIGNQVTCLLKKEAHIDKNCLLILKDLVDDLFQHASFQYTYTQQDADIDYDFSNEYTESEYQEEQAPYYHVNLPLSSQTETTKTLSTCTSSSGVESLLNTPEFY